MPKPSDRKNKIIDAFDAHCVFRYALEFQSRQNDSLKRLNELTAEIVEAIQCAMPQATSDQKRYLTICTLNGCGEHVRARKLPQWLRDSRSTVTRGHIDKFATQLVARFVDQAKTLDLIIGNVYSWALIALNDIGAKELLRIYTDLQHGEKDFDSLWNIENAPERSSSASESERFLADWLQFRPIKRIERPLGPSLIDTARWPVMVGRERLHNHLLLALPYSRPIEDLDGLFDGYKRYIKRLAMTYAGKQQKKLAENDIIALLDSAEKIESPPHRHQRILIQNGGAIVSHLCGLLCVEHCGFRGSSRGQVKAIYTEAAVVINAHGFRYNQATSRMAYDAIGSNLNIVANEFGWSK